MAKPRDHREATVISETSRRDGLARRHLRDPRVLLATGLGCGLLPGGPGTIGAFLGVAAWWLVLADLDFTSRVVATVAAAGASFLVIDRVVKRYALDDAPAIVLDEFAGCWVALLASPKAWAPVIAAFALFRLFDIAKPWPVSWADRRPGALGILLDDIIAGALAALGLAIGQQAVATLPRFGFI